MQADSFNVNQPPNAEARVRQFLDLSAEYLLLVPLRRGSPAYFTEGSAEALASLREGLLAHMLMRKFITKGESVYIPRVFECLLGDFKEQIQATMAKDLRAYMYGVSTALKNIMERGVQYGINGAEAVSDRVMLDRYLHGRLLHSDHDKWQHVDSTAFRVMLGSWLQVRAEFRDHLEASRHNVYVAVNEHSLFSLPDKKG